MIGYINLKKNKNIWMRIYLTEFYWNVKITANFK